jgi:hypothetical protein
LTTRATRLTDVSKWDLLDQSGIQCAGSYHWLSDHQLLNIRGVHMKWTQSGPNTFLGQFLGTPSALLYDLHTGRETSLFGLTRLLASNSVGSEMDASPSPNGRWILWSDNRHGFRAATVEGKQLRLFPEQPQNAYGDVLWLSDNRHWLHFLWDTKSRRITGVHLHDIDQPTRVQTLPILAASPIQSSYPGFALMQDHFLWTDRLHSSTNPVNQPRQLTFEVCELHAGAASIGKRIVTMPPGCVIADFVISTRGDRIAWKLYQEAGSPLQTFLHRTFAFYKDASSAPGWTVDHRFGRATPA